jgi:hypothetical protein
MIVETSSVCRWTDAERRVAADILRLRLATHRSVELPGRLLDLACPHKCVEQAALARRVQRVIDDVHDTVDWAEAFLAAVASNRTDGANGAVEH